MATLDRLGGATTIVRAHLDDAMATLSPAQQDACADALRFFVTAGGRKIALTDAEVLSFAEVPAEVLSPALDQLQERRIFRRVRVPGADSARELFHDILAPAVLEWRRRHDEGRRLAGLQRRNQRLATAVVVLLAALIAVGAYAVNPDGLRKVELGTVDARVRSSPAAGAHPDVALVGMDDQTVASLGAAPLREGYAALIREIDALNPRAIAVDVLFDKPGAEGSQAVLDALDAAHAAGRARVRRLHGRPGQRPAGTAAAGRRSRTSPRTAASRTPGSATPVSLRMRTAVSVAWRPRRRRPAI